MPPVTPVKKKQKTDRIIDDDENRNVDSNNNTNREISLETIKNSPFKKSTSPQRNRISHTSSSFTQLTVMNTNNNELTDNITTKVNTNTNINQTTASQNEIPLLLPPSLELSTKSTPSRGRSIVISSQNTISQQPYISSTTHRKSSPFRRRSPMRSPYKTTSSSSSQSQKLELIKLSPTKSQARQQMLLHQQEIFSQHQNLASSTNGYSRLCIEKLILTNFKSYAGEQVVGPFHPNFTAVVGPNGSGKSNVIDSMLFVFGFRANKLRQGKVSELIHKSENYPNLSFCSVDIHFRYVTDDEFDKSKPALIISRKVFKNNSSKYYVNGKESSYTKVTLLLKEEGIDLDHKRFLILQGEVESIAQMKAKAEKDGEDGLLEYLEDIIGTSKYKIGIEESFKEIEVLNDACLEKENRFHIVETAKDSLENDKEKALEFLSKEKQLTICTSKLYQYEIWNKNEKLTSILNKINDLNATLNAERLKFEEQQRAITELNNKGKEYENTLKDLRSQQNLLVDRKKKITKKKISNEEKSKNLNNKNKNLTNTVESLKQKLNKFTSLIEETSTEQSQQETHLQELNQKLDIEKQKLNEITLHLKDQTVEINAQIEGYEKELDPWVTKLEEIKSNISLEESKINILTESHKTLEDEICRIKDKMSLSEKSIEEFSIKKQKRTKELNLVVKNIDAGEKACAQAKVKIDEIMEVVSTQRQQANEARNSLSAHENQNKVLHALSRLQQSGRIHGFHGRLGDLGTISEKYNVAISTACPRLNDIVVDTVECGQQCIEHLRKNKLGYARFILLDKLRNFNISKINTPENVSRLFDLVECNEPKFLPAFYSVLRDTLVATNLDQANRVAYGHKRFRVVTMDGKLIDISGTMTGGGRQVMKDLMSSKKKITQSSYTPQQVSEIEASLSAREVALNEARKTYHEMEEELNSLNNRKPQIENEILKLSLNIQSCESEIVNLNSQLKDVNKQLQEENTANNLALSSANANIKILQEEYNKVECNTTTVNSKIKELRDQIMKIGGMKLQMQNSIVDSLNQQISITTSKLRKCKTQFKKFENELKRTKKNLFDSEKDVLKTTTELENLQTELKSVEEQLLSLEEDLLEISNKEDETQENFENIKKKLDETNDSYAKFKSLEVEFGNKLGNLETIKKELQRDIEKCKKKLDSLKIRDVTQLLIKLNEEILSTEIETTKTSTENQQKSGNDEFLDADQEEPEGGEDGMDIDTDNNTTTDSTLIPELTEEELNKLDVKSLELDIKDLEAFMENSTSDIGVLEEYASRLAEYKSRKISLNEAIEKRNKVLEHCESLKKKRLDEFMEGFNLISMTLKEMYQMITLGGNAELELVDTLDPFSEGVLFSVMPPKKSWRNISNLSGGEKTLSSLALVFALHKYKPTPLYVMDEIDAALDFRNVSIVANYIKERTKNAQFIVISLRNNMFELAKQLVGIYKNSNMTKSAALKNKDLLHEVQV
ncbi:related to Structural maintenance of chromosomes protein 4 [Saccharomycodes ludwigii]|uniref:Structural maintenance of chromosomes protein n=1 Tax=Saccharomycodes ludwigii TaxID=36035 RepID=A0A376B2D1_9ASCO|nr:hypothetical protein SCDLUD_001695 [Saccharomycodes ludwigii]KAH3901911.1 hypothetical protein SCDLUD_001695 [Saccharomycodes ludwigii]SSD58280.1 related to Structural maintenance of chromosomes protein 4 [Saccharomycodes ludwigii]